MLPRATVLVLASHLVLAAAAAALADVGDYTEMPGAGGGSVTAGTTALGKVFLVSGNRVHCTDPATRETVPVGDKKAQWSTGFAIGHEGALYFVEAEGCLYRFDAKTYKHEEVTHGEWTSVRAGCSLGDKIYLADTGKLYAVDPKTGQREPIGPEDVSWNPLALVALEGSIYAFEADGHLYRVDPKDGKREDVGGDTWSSITAACAVGDRLYVAQGYLFAVDPKTGAKEQIGLSEWGPRLMIGCGDKVYAYDANRLYEIVVK